MLVGNNIALVIPLKFIPEAIFVKEAMNLWTKKRKNVAVVLD
jgi:putative hemolysin